MKFLKCKEAFDGGDHWKFIEVLKGVEECIFSRGGSVDPPVAEFISSGLLTYILAFLQKDGGDCDPECLRIASL